MFAFEKFGAYKLAKEFNQSVRRFINNARLERFEEDQLKRASFSVILNIAEGTGRFSSKDRRHFYVIARSSLIESIALLDILKAEKRVSQEVFREIYEKGQSLSILLYSQIRQLEVKKNV